MLAMDRKTQQANGEQRVAVHVRHAASSSKANRLPEVMGWRMPSSYPASAYLIERIGESAPDGLKTALSAV